VVVRLRVSYAYGYETLRFESKLEKDSVIIVVQFYALDRQKFIERIAKVKRETMEKIENGMMLVLGIKKQE
jgi:mRNA-degrading endonuclease toxin of MazEF toxin-antitoxin module